MKIKVDAKVNPNTVAVATSIPNGNALHFFDTINKQLVATPISMHNKYQNNSNI